MSDSKQPPKPLIRPPKADTSIPTSQAASAPSSSSSGPSTSPRDPVSRRRAGALETPKSPRKPFSWSRPVKRVLQPRVFILAVLLPAGILAYFDPLGFNDQVQRTFGDIGPRSEVTREVKKEVKEGHTGISKEMAAQDRAAGQVREAAAAAVSSAGQGKR